jgi:hypothetical protein
MKTMGFCQVADGMKIGGRPSAQVGAMFRLGAIASFKLLSNETIDPKPDGNENLAGVSAQVGAMFRLVAIAAFKLLNNETIDPKPDGMKIGGRPSAQVGAMFRLVAIASFKLLSNETIDPKPAIGAPAFSRPKRLARSLRSDKIATKASRSPLRGVLVGVK